MVHVHHIAASADTAVLLNLRGIWTPICVPPYNYIGLLGVNAPIACGGGGGGMIRASM